MQQHHVTTAQYRQCQDMIAGITNILTANEQLTVSLRRRRQLVGYRLLRATTTAARLPAVVSLTGGTTS